MRLLSRLFAPLPKPYALPSRSFSTGPDDKSYTWEDYYEEMSAKYPFRYWLHETFPDFIRTIRNKLHVVIYWIKSHTYKKHHILDLRSPVGIQYKYGWIDVDEAMMIACFNLLRRFVEEESGLRWADTDGVTLEQNSRLMEIKELYEWWMTGREKDHEKINEYLGDKDGFRLSKFLDYGETITRLENKDNEMLDRLMKVRESLWT